MLKIKESDDLGPNSVLVEGRPDIVIGGLTRGTRSGTGEVRYKIGYRSQEEHFIWTGTVRRQVLGSYRKVDSHFRFEKCYRTYRDVLD